VSDIDYSNASIDAGYRHPAYEDFVALWPYDVVAHQVDGTYQGSHYFLFRRESMTGRMRFGLIDISFAVCDFLRGVFDFGDWNTAENIEKVEDFFERRRKSIEWRSASEMRTFLEELPDSCKWRDVPADKFLEAMEVSS